MRDETFEQLTSAFTLFGEPPPLYVHVRAATDRRPRADTVETYFDSHVDLLQRQLQKHGGKLKLKAGERFKIKDLKIKDLKIKDLLLKDLSGDLLAENLEREIKGFKIKVCLAAA